MKEHHIKIESHFYDAVEDGSKTFEIRENDRNYQCGDIVVLHEIDDEGQKTSHSMAKEITYMTDFAQCENYVVLAITQPKMATLQTKYSLDKSLLLREGYDWEFVVNVLTEQQATREVNFWKY